jgi:hypothetical protein
MGRNPWDFLIFGPFQDGDGDEESRLDGTAGGRKEVAKEIKGERRNRADTDWANAHHFGFSLFLVSTLSYGLGLDQTMFNIAGMLLPLQIISNGRKRKATESKKRGERAAEWFLAAAVVPFPPFVISLAGTVSFMLFNISHLVVRMRMEKYLPD